MSTPAFYNNWNMGALPPSGGVILISLVPMLVLKVAQLEPTGNIRQMLML
jgi:hypothetical protein